MLRFDFDRKRTCCCTPSGKSPWDDDDDDDDVVLNLRTALVSTFDKLYNFGDGMLMLMFMLMLVLVLVLIDKKKKRMHDMHNTSTSSNGATILDRIISIRSDCAFGLPVDSYEYEHIEHLESVRPAALHFEFLRERPSKMFKLSKTTGSNLLVVYVLYDVCHTLWSLLNGV